MNLYDAFQGAYLILHYALTVLALGIGAFALGAFLYQSSLELRHRHARKNTSNDLNCLTFFDE